MTFTWIYISSQVETGETYLDANFIAGKTYKNNIQQKQPVKFTWIYISSQVGKSETCLDFNFIAGKKIYKTTPTNKQTNKNNQ